MHQFEGELITLHLERMIAAVAVTAEITGINEGSFSVQFLNLAIDKSVKNPLILEFTLSCGIPSTTISGQIA